MMSFFQISSTIKNWEEAAKTVADWKQAGEKIVFTNGCFDLLHFGHLHYLAEARELGSKLVIGLNSSDSVSRLKGPHRPINDENTRAHMLASLKMVDLVVIFTEDTPLDLIHILTPDVLVKGGDWSPEQIIGSDWVLQHGGEVRSLAFMDGYSTTNIEQKIKSS
ncbi:MAG: D-glycero-beta-D-manno-heptose 1-phosphate adenylyltransferase [Saprospiraceae bacterium]|nr:D-glycero-beta-D-manno-heptose 1-phosphate adenylyltransferase [Saprospiraceae bacterium]